MAPTVAPGMGQASIGNAVVVPEYNQQQFARADYLNQLQEQQKLADAKAAAVAKQHQQALEKYADNLISQKDYANTGDMDADGHIVDMQKQALATLSTMAQDPSADTASLTNAAYQLSSQIEKYHNDVNYVKNAINTSTGGLTKFPGVDASSLQRAALAALIKTPNANGVGMTLKDPDDIDASDGNIHQIINGIIDKHPDLVITTSDGQQDDATNWRPAFDKVEPQTQAGEMTVNQYGKDITKKYNVKLQPWQTMVTDSTGKPVIDPNTGKPKVEIMSQQAPNLADGTPSGVTILANAPFGTMESSINGRLAIADSLKKYNDQRQSQGLSEIDPTSSTGEILKKKIAYDILNERDKYGNLVSGPLLNQYDTKYDTDKQYVQQMDNYRFNKNFDLKYGQDNAGANVPPIVAQINAKHGINVITNQIDPITQQYQQTRFIPFNTIDPQDKKTIQFSEKDPVTGIPSPVVNPITITGSGGNKMTGFMVNQDGDLVGEGGQIIDKDAIQSRAIDNYKKETVQIKAPVTTRVATTYIINGKPYSHSDLNKLGYTDAQIQTAMQMGTIKNK